MKRLADWLWQGGHIFSGPLIGIGLPLVAARLFPTEFGFRLVGFSLQVLGVWIVWVGIRGTREQFEVPGWRDQVKAWTASFPRLRERVISASITLSGSADIASGRAYGWHGTAPGATLDERVAAIEKNLRNVRDEFSAHQKEADDRARAHDDEMKRERAERKAADKEIQDKIKETETGGLHLNWSGVWWLLSGTICSTFPEGLAQFVAWVNA